MEIWKHASLSSMTLNQSFLHSKVRTDSRITIRNFVVIMYLFNSHRSKIGQRPLSFLGEVK